MAPYPHSSFSPSLVGHSLDELNAPERLQAIADAYWPGLRDLARLRVRRLQRARYDAACPRCGDRTWVLHAPRNYVVMCLTCRGLAFPRAGDPRLLDLVRRSLGDGAVRPRAQSLSRAAGEASVASQGTDFEL